MDILGECVTGGRLSAEDLLCTYIEHRVLPLQRRVHKIGHMSGRLDPTRTSKLALTKAQLFNRQGIEDGDLAQNIWTPDHIDPADQAGDQAGDDDLPVVPDQGGQGEHNPLPSPEHEPEPEEPSESGTGPIPAVPLRSRPPGALAASAPQGRKRAGGGSTAKLEARAKKQHRVGPKKVPEAAGAAIKFTQGGGSRPPPRVEPMLLRQRRESTPQSSMRAPPVVIVPPAGTSSAAPSAVPSRGTQGEPVHRPMLDEMFPRRAPLLGPAAGAGRGAPPATGAGAGGGCVARYRRLGPAGLRRLKLELGPAGLRRLMLEPAGLRRRREPEAARVPQLESDLWAARAQCADSEEAGRAAAAKLKVADGELTRLRKLEANHLKELAALKKDGEEKLEGLSKRLEEVERQWLALREEVNSKSKELSLTCFFFAAAFPEAQEAALTAVGKAREARRQATGEQSSAFFTMDDYLASMAARPIYVTVDAVADFADQFTRLVAENSQLRKTIRSSADQVLEANTLAADAKNENALLKEEVKKLK
nr:uncharacterized protein LOC127316068 [Lolium perenne]